MGVRHSNKTGSAFWRSAREDEVTGCWEWQGMLDICGYGRLKVDGRSTPAHRYAWELVNGPIPEGQVVWHACGNFRCVRPDHLEALPRAEQRLRTRRAITPERFWSRVEKAPEPDGCWIWQGRLTPNGYGFLSVRTKPITAHRYAYTLTYGALPDDVELIHRCDEKRCVRPEHLELADRAIISQRYWSTVTHCSHGHPRTPENTYTTPKGDHLCRLCHNDRIRRYKARRRAENQAASSAPSNCGSDAVSANVSSVNTSDDGVGDGATR
ncbi:MAG TPA: HNH endonuclease signature motif containing protein [Ktedonobacterales bacterium]|nr:HNH endonuclease signature motif containing protein [Ktedonobacterales bacterium]